jgi:uncharacterized protein
VLDAVAATVSDEPRPAPEWPAPAARPDGATPLGGNGAGHDVSHDGAGEFEVLCLLDADPAAIGRLRRRWAALGTSVATVGSGGLWKCHVHTGNPQAAVDVARRAGRALRTEVSALPGDHR